MHEKDVKDNAKKYVKEIKQKKMIQEGMHDS
jgi:hypothetical protein